MGNDQKVSFTIVFITQDDPFYVRLFFEEFFRLYENPNEIRAVVIAQAMGKKSLFQLARQMYRFYGPVNFLKMGSRYAACRLLPILPCGIKAKARYSLEKLCEINGIQVVHQGNVNAQPFLGWLKKMNPDLVISVAAPVIFKKSLIDLPRFGCINIHNGKLPRYRGMMPNFWQMYHGENAIGLTIHEINPKIDDGRIILQKDIEILPDETLDSLMKRTKRIGARFMIEAIEIFKTGKATYKENPLEEGSYFSFPTKEDVREFKRRGKRMM
jgi:methionyl-tRNA formyltransferase